MACAETNTVSGTDGNDTLIVNTEQDTHTFVYAGDGNDSVTNAGLGTVHAYLGCGDDTYVGGPGVDLVQGGPGDDHITLGGGNDVANGGSGNDWIFGGVGNDTLTGGPGDDHFYYPFIIDHDSNGAITSAVSHCGNDVITDFNLSEDHLEFQGTFSQQEFNDLFDVTHVDTDGDGAVDASSLHFATDNPDFPFSIQFNDVLATKDEIFHDILFV